MIEVEVNSIRVSLMNQQRIVVLKDINEERYLPIWIGQFEADAITIELQENRTVKRPLTHDLLKATIEELGGRIDHIFINDMRRDIFYARLVVELNSGEKIEIDSRPSDAIAIAVRAKAPIFVSEAVMEKSSVEPEEDIELEDMEDLPDFARSLGSSEGEKKEEATTIGGEELPTEDQDIDEEVDESQFSAFSDFVNSLDLDELNDDDDQNPN